MSSGAVDRQDKGRRELQKEVLLATGIIALYANVRNRIAFWSGKGNPAEQPETPAGEGLAFPAGYVDREIQPGVVS